MKKLLSSLLLILLIASLTFLSGLGLTNYFQQRGLPNPLLERCAIILVSGLIAGFSTRLILRKRHFIFRILVAMVTVGMGLFILDKLYPKTYALVFFKDAWSDPVWIDLLQVGLGSVMGMLALFIGTRWKKTRQIVKSKPRTKPQTKSAPKPIQVKAKSVESKKKSGKAPVKKAIASRPLPTIKPTGLFSQKKRQLRKKDVKLLGETEHRCPYCLELVKKNDPRGVVICPECKTWHHKDCWDVTGTCQVAHRHDL